MNKNQTIHFLIKDGSIGTLLVAKSDQGIAAILMGEDAMMLRSELQAQFISHSVIEAQDDQELLSVINWIENPVKPFDLPLHVEGTAFQQRVWAAIQAIPVGKTMSYAEIAVQVGSPKAVRAVGSACGANKIAIVIPCHRVVGSKGALAGYRWGLDYKRRLLAREAA